MIEYPNECKLNEPLIFDTHSHYIDPKFDGERDELLTKMHQNGVDGLIVCGCCEDSSRKGLDLAEKYDFVYAAVGIHPGDIALGTDLTGIKEMAQHKKCVAIGEIGLDYYWSKEDREMQMQVFEEQIILAKELNMPIIVHNRDAHQDTLALLKKYKPKGVLHCFSGSKQIAEQILSFGMYIGVGGVVTFKNARKLPEVVEIIPDDRLLIETDCPFLAPEPYRGKTCHSGLISLTAEKIAELRGSTRDDILKLTNKNAKELFGIL